MQLAARTGARSWDAYDLACVLCAFAAVACVLWVTAPFGPGVDSDSAQYLSAAEGAARGAGWITVDGTPYTLWPPLFPTVLAVSSWLGISTLSAARWLGAFSAFAVVIGGALCVRRIAFHRAAPLLCAIALATASALVANCAMAMSEPLFLALCVATFWAWLRYVDCECTARFLVLTGLSIAAVSQRYLAVTLVASIALLLLASNASLPLAQRARRCATYLACVAAPVALWIARNRMVAGQLDGKRGPPAGELLQDARAVATWWVDGFGLDFGSRALAVATSSIPLAMFGYAAWSAVRREPRARVFVLFAVAYAAGLVALRQVIEFDALEERLLVPLVAPLWVAVIVGADGWLARATGIAHTVSVCVFGAWFAAHIALASVELRNRAAAWRADGIALYEAPRWQHSPTVEWLRTQQSDGAWMSNDPFAVFCTTGLRSTALPLRKQGFARLRERLVADPGRRNIVWFTMNERAVFPAAMLAPGLHVERVQQFADGEIYVVR